MRRVAAATANSSRIGNIFWPKAPPTSPMTTRMRSSGICSSRDMFARTSCGPCVLAWMVSDCWAGSHEAMRPRGSIGTQL